MTKNEKIIAGIAVGIGVVIAYKYAKSKSGYANLTAKSPYVLPKQGSIWRLIYCTWYPERCQPHPKGDAIGGAER